ncbi:Riboflavin kinase [Aphelenchoides fujianensis]|nr:Riboflavin kinase [Aphelenchoides fujianensis]
MPEQPEVGCSTRLLRFLPLVDPTAPKGQLLDLFPRFKDCLEELLEDTLVGWKVQLYTPKCRPLFGRLVHTLLALFGDPKQDKRVRGECCRLLFELVDSRRETTASSASVAFVLPGIVTKCTAVIKAEPNSEFTPSALLLVREVLQSTLNNELARRLRSSPDIEEGSPVALQRDERWLQTTGNRILQALEIIFGQTAASPLESCRSKLLESMNTAAERCDERLGRTRPPPSTPTGQSAIWRSKSSPKWRPNRPAAFEKQAAASIDGALEDMLKGRPNSLDALRTVAQFMAALPPAQLKKFVEKRPKSPNFFRRLRRALLMSVDVEKKKILTREAAIDPENIFVCIPLKETIKEEIRGVDLQAMAKPSSAVSPIRCGRPARTLAFPPTLLMSRLCCAMAAHRAGFVDGKTEVVIRRAVGRWLKRLDEFVDLEPDPNDSAPSAQFALDKTAKACGQSTEDFLGENADRVVFKLAAMSRKLDEHPRAPFALAALLDRGFGRKMVDDLVNLIPELLNGINTEDKKGKMKKRKERTGIGWRNCAKKFEKLKTKRENPFAAARQVPDDEKRPPPPLIACVHRIPPTVPSTLPVGIRSNISTIRSIPYTRLLLNDLLCAGLRFVRHFDDQLLPMIHQNWPTFRRPEKLIVAAELRMVVCMCETSGSFVYRKILEELDQPLHDYMLETMRVSERTWPSFCELAAVPQERARAVFTAYANDRLQNPELRKLAAEGLERLGGLSSKE